MKKNFLLILCVFLISYVPVHGARKYQIKQKLGRYNNSLSAYAITDEGELFGWKVGFDWAPTFFRYKNGQYQFSPFSSKWISRALANLPIAYNSHGQVAFTLETVNKGFFRDSYDTRLVLWNLGSEPIILGKPEGWDRFKLVAFTDKGQILIQRLDYLPKETTEARIAFWSDGKFTFIPSSFMSEAIAFVDDFIYGNIVRESHIAPRVFNTKKDEAKNLEFPENTALTFVDKQHCLFGAVVNIVKNIDDEDCKRIPVQGVYKAKGSVYSSLPDNFIPLSSKEKGKVIGMISKEIFLLDLETNELFSINENIINKNGKSVTYKNLKFLNGNSKGELIFCIHDDTWRGSLDQNQVTYVLSPIEIP